MNTIYKKISYILVVCAICVTVPIKHAEAHSGIVSAPSSCGALDSTNLNTHSYNQIYNRTSISSASTGKNIFSTKVNSTSTPWVRNADIWSSKGTTPIDWTGVAAYVYNNSNPNYFPSSRIATLISPRHFLAASHWQPNPGEILSFIDANGNQVLRTVVAHQYLGNDLTVGVLDTDVPSTITYYPLIASSTLAAKTLTLEPGDMDLTIVAFNQTPRLVVRDVYSILNAYNQTSHFPYTSGSFSQFSEGAIGGDSGSPAFILIDSKPVLLTAYTGPGGGPAYGNYISQINSAMTTLGGGYQVTQYDASCFSNKVLNYAPAMSVVETSATTTVHQASSTVITTLSATDPDSDTLQFSLGSFTSVASTTLSLNANDYFSINSSGELRQIQDLDPDTQGYSLRLVVHVTDIDPTPGTSTTYITLNVDRMETTSILTADSVIEITYDKIVATSSVPSTSDFAVTVNGSARAVTSVSIVSNEVILGLASPVAVDQTVRVTYTPGTNPIKDYPSLAKAPALDNVLVANSVAGSINTNFLSGNGINGTPSQILGLFLDSNNKILVGGSSLITSYSASSSVNKSILRLNSDGTIDTSFNYRGDLTVWRQGGVKQQADGKYIIVGNNISNYTSLGIERVNYDGSVDSTFTGQWDFNCNSTAVVIQNDGKIVSGSGCEQTYTGTTQKALARILSNGNLDTTFNSGGAGLDDGSFVLRVEDLVLQPDQKILVGGEFGSYNGTTRYDLLRLNSDGTLDTSFNHSLPLTGIQTTVADIELLSNGQMYVSLLNSATTTPAVYRLNADGSTDTTFVSKNFRKISGTNQGVNVYSVKQASDGKIIVAGNFERYDNQIANGLVRILSNGDVDGTFVTSGGLGSTTVGFSEYFMYSAQILPDGNLVAVGTFPTYDGVTKNNIVGVLTQTTSDATQPTVSNITSSVSNGTYIIGDTIPVQVTFSEPVIVVGSSPTLSLNVSSTTVRTATYTSGSGSSTLTFSYVVQPGDVSIDLDYIDAASLNISAGNLEDAAGNHAILTLPTPGQAGSLSANKNILVDGTVPVPVSAVISGDVVTLVFDSTVSTTSIPSASAFTIKVNANSSYTSVRSVTVDNFSKITLGLFYPVQNGHVVSLSYAQSGTTIKDTNGNLVAAFTDFSLENNTPVTAVQSSTPGSTGGGGGGGGGTASVIYTNRNTTSVTNSSSNTRFTSASTTITIPQNKDQVCVAYLSQSIRLGSNNSSSEVIKLQKFLNEFEGESLSLSGVYDTVTVQAVERFQKKYAKHILSPWGLTNPTGVVSVTTRAKINALVCGKTYGCPFFTEYYKFGSSGSEIKSIKSFLNLLNPSAGLNTSYPFYDTATRREIINFQNRYKDTVLKPWGLTSATSFWYKTTVQSANEILGCQ